MMTELEKDIYGQQTVNVEKPVMGIKDYIRYFDKVRDTMASTRRTSSSGWTEDEVGRSSGRYVCAGGNSHGPAKSSIEPAKPRSKIELLKEQIFNLEEQPYKNEERMEEVEKLCKLRGESGANDEAEIAGGEWRAEKASGGLGGATPKYNAAMHDSIAKADEAPGMERNDTVPRNSMAKSPAYGSTVKEGAASVADRAETLPSTVSISSNTHPSCDNNDDLLRDLESLDTCEFMDFDEKLNEKIEELNKDSQQDNGAAAIVESESLDVITKDIMAEGVFSNNEISKLDEEVKLHVSTLKSEIESQFRTQLVRPKSPAASKLPNSSELVGDFRNFKARPALFRCQPLSCTSQVVSKNLFTSCVNKEYSNATEKTLAASLTITVPLFSKVDLGSQKHVFRGPGPVMPSRPSLRLHSSILTEQGILYYLNVADGDESNWFVRKDLKIKTDAAATINELNVLPDRDFNAFIVSNVVTSVFRRTSYVYYNGRIMLLKFVGKSLCVCEGKKIVHVVRLEGASVAKLDGARPSFVVGGTAFGCSCTIERDEWFDCINQTIEGKC